MCAEPGLEFVNSCWSISLAGEVCIGESNKFIADWSVQGNVNYFYVKYESQSFLQK